MTKPVKKRHGPSSCGPGPDVTSIFSPSEYDIPVFEKSGKGGTYPRRYGIPFGLQDYSDGGCFFLLPPNHCGCMSQTECHSSWLLAQEGRPSPEPGERRFTAFVRRSASAQRSSRPAPAAAAASLPPTWRRLLGPPGGGGAATSSQTSTHRRLPPSRSWTSVHPAAVSPSHQ